MKLFKLTSFLGLILAAVCTKRLETSFKITVFSCTVFMYIHNVLNCSVIK